MSVRRAIMAAALGGCAGDGSGSDCGPSSATVMRVIDGDTVELAGGERVRYLLVDAPEATNGHNDCFGQNAAQFNRDLVEGKAVELTYDRECRDVYGRLLAFITVGGQDVNALLVERGYACVLYIPPDGMARHAELAQDEVDAKAARRGMWSACEGMITCE
jgi:micrococcal nuclease